MNKMDEWKEKLNRYIDILRDAISNNNELLINKEENTYIIVGSFTVNKYSCGISKLKYKVINLEGYDKNREFSQTTVYC